MYSISTLIVGVPATPELAKLLDRWELENSRRWVEEWEDLGFTELYHGAAPQPVCYCGVEIGEWDECGEWMRLTPKTLTYKGYGETREISLSPTPEQIAEAKKKVDSLDPEVRATCPEFGVYIIQSTS